MFAIQWIVGVVLGLKTGGLIATVRSYTRKGYMSADLRGYDYMTSGWRFDYGIKDVSCAAGVFASLCAGRGRQCPRSSEI